MGKEWHRLTAAIGAAGGPVLEAVTPIQLGRRPVWAAVGEQGPVIVKVRRDEETPRKASWCSEALPLLAARGYPAPEYLWHGSIPAGHAVVLRRLPGAPSRVLDESLLDAVLALVELQAGAGVYADDRDGSWWTAAVLFDDFAGYWRDAAATSRALCRRLEAFLRPSWGHSLGHTDFTHGDLNLANVLTDGQRVTGVVDWDDFALNSRAADLGTILFEWYRLALGGHPRLAARGPERLTERIVAIAGEAGLRCIVVYAAVARLAVTARRRQPEGHARWVHVTEAALDDLGG